MAEAKKKTTKNVTLEKPEKAVVKKATKTKAVKKPVDVIDKALEIVGQEQDNIKKQAASSVSQDTVGTEVMSNELVTNGETDEETELATTKAGKRSSKAQREATQEAERLARKDSADSEADETKPKQASAPTRSRLERRGKGFRESAKLLEVGKVYDVEEAIALAQKTSRVKFDATVELHINLSVDPRHADQNIRDNLVLPAGTGKTIKVAVLTDDAAEAKKAGADIAGNEELLAQLEKGQMNFDILISTPLLMAKLGKYARMLGPRGLMPNPKSGTVTTDVNKAIAEAKAGRVEYRVDSTGIVHLGVGKVSFTAPQLLDNIQAVLTSIKNNKPASVKGSYFKAIHMTTTMGPSLTVNLSSVN